MTYIHTTTTDCGAPANLSAQSIISISSRSTIRSSNATSKHTPHNSTIASENTKPTLIDHYYDLLKSVHLHITVRPFIINLASRQIGRTMVNYFSIIKHFI